MNIQEGILQVKYNDTIALNNVTLFNLAYALAKELRISHDFFFPCGGSTSHQLTSPLGLTEILQSPAETALGKRPRQGSQTVFSGQMFIFAFI